MTDPGLNAIKRKSIGNIFSFLSDGSEKSRSELSGLTGMSLMTIGKAAELLESSAVIVQRKDTSNAAGRKSLLCSLDMKRRIIVIDSARAIYTLDLMKNLTGCFLIGGAEPLGETLCEPKVCADSFEAMLSALEECGGEPFGIGQITHPGEEPFCDQLTPDIIENEITASAMGFAAESSSIYFKLNALLEPIGAAVILDKKPYRGREAEAGRLAPGSDIDEALRIAEFFAPESIRFELPNALRDDSRLEKLKRSRAELVFNGAAISGMAELLIMQGLDRICQVI